MAAGIIASVHMGFVDDRKSAHRNPVILERVNFGQRFGACLSTYSAEKERLSACLSTYSAEKERLSACLSTYSADKERLSACLSTYSAEKERLST